MGYITNKIVITSGKIHKMSVHVYYIRSPRIMTRIKGDKVQRLCLAARVCLCVCVSACADYQGVNGLVCSLAWFANDKF